MLKKISIPCVVGFLLYALMQLLSHSVLAQGYQTWSFDSCAVLAQDTVKILSWNIYMLPTPFTTTQQLQRAKAIVEVLDDADYDVVVLQEVFKKKVFSYLVENLRCSYPHFYTTPFKARFLKTTSGLLVVSKLPITQTASILFKECKGADCIAQKGALLVEVEKNSRRLQIVGTHLQAEEDSASQSIRERQYASILGKLLQPFRKPNVPQVIAGDLNTSRYNPHRYKRMMQVFRAEDAGAPHDYRDKKLFSYDGSQNDIVRKVWKSTQDLLDYVLVRKNRTEMQSYAGVKIFRKQWRKENRDLSDHYAIEAKIILE